MKDENIRRCIVLFSGGLDSRLAVKIMQEKDFNIKAVFFKLPFIKENLSEINSFCEENSVELEVVDCTKGKLLQEYLDVLRKPQFSRGKGYNPCIDCKIFILKKTKEIADKLGIEFIVTGDVLDERPLSQTKKALNSIEQNAGVQGRVFRPLSARLFEKTIADEKNLLDKENFYDIQGKKREKQEKLAENFGIDYPNPSGGCLLCEPLLKNRFKELFYRDIDEKKVNLMTLGRHFLIDDYWIVLGRNEAENKFIEEIVDDNENLFVPDEPGPTAVIFPEKISGLTEEIKEKVRRLVKTYSKKGSEKEKKEFEKNKI